MTNPFSNVIDQISEVVDHTQTSTGSSFTPTPEGASIARLVDYIEVGVHPQKPYLGKPKPDAAGAYVTFELYGPKPGQYSEDYVKEIEVDGTKRRVAERITIPLVISLNEKSKFKKLFKKMTYGRDNITHYSQMLGEGFVVVVKHNVVGEGKDAKTYANITDEDGTFLVKSPYKVDELAGTQEPLDVPEAVGNMRLFVWDVPTKETWDSIFIDGERETKDDKGNVKQVSKNWLQNMIKDSKNFEGSPVQAFIEGSTTLPENPDELKEEVKEEKAPKKEAKKQSKKEPEQDDALAALGLA